MIATHLGVKNGTSFPIVFFTFQRFFSLGGSHGSEKSQNFFVLFVICFIFLLFSLFC